MQQYPGKSRAVCRPLGGVRAHLQEFIVAMAAAFLPIFSPAALALECGLPATQDPAPASAAETRFSLAQAACGGLPQAHAGEARPRAAQLALYERGFVSGTLTEGAFAPPSLSTEVYNGPALNPSGGQTRRIVGLAPTLSAAALRHDIDPLLLHAIAHVESRHNTQAVSPAGARGVMQVMPATARRFGLADPQRELMSAPLNVEVSASYLKVLQARFGNDLPLVLAAYNAGEGAVERHRRRVPPYAETQAYVKQVLAAYAALRTLVAGGSGKTAGRAAP